MDKKIGKKSVNKGHENITPGGPGRPKGQRNYATIYREALKKIAVTQDMTPDEIEELMLQSGLKKAIKGDLGFYKDTMDRLHGRPVQKSEISGPEGGPVKYEISNKKAQALADKYEEELKNEL